MKLHEIPTPALVVDLPAMERNIPLPVTLSAAKGLAPLGRRYEWSHQ